MMDYLSNSLRMIKPSPDEHLIRKANVMESVIRLQGGDPDFNTPRNIVDKLLESVNLGETHYPPTHGIQNLRESLSKYYQKKGVTYSSCTDGRKTVVFKLERESRFSISPWCQAP